jgi:hypothetical protein
MVLPDDWRGHRGRAPLADLLLPCLRSARIGGPAGARPAPWRGDFEPHPVGVVSAVLAKCAVRGILWLGAIAANLTCCSSARFTPSAQPDVAQECRMMSQLAADQTLTPTQLADIRKNMDKAGCSVIP